ncbi:MAG: class I SAM-dependent methyltransferase [Phycisphaeraceae bacterium]|nr:class I SAM-dependent methyltransferase [Phycisphaeraceae bacterium]
MNITRPAKLALMLSRWRLARHSAAIRRRFPRIDEPLPREIQQELAMAHAEYTDHVSGAGMAASLETSLLLWRLCDQMGPIHLLDTGSGFSSFVLRRWARDRGDALVWSLDDDEQWLERTREYLASRNLSDEGLMTWEQFAAGHFGPFDLVFHDLGSMETRIRTLPRVLERMHTQTGVLVLDDTHNLEYETAALDQLRRYRATMLDAHSWTIDRFRRRAAIACDIATPPLCNAA